MLLLPPRCFHFLDIVIINDDDDDDNNNNNNNDNDRTAMTCT